MILQCKHVSKYYAAPDKLGKIPVLHDINLSVEKGESVAILGPSGSGKSTLLHICGLLDTPSSGNVYINDEEVTGITEKNRDVLRNREIGFVFQLHHLLPQCTVLENVLLPTLPRYAAGKTGDRVKKAEYLLGRVGLGSRISHRPWQLSGGELQRVAFVRALINSPKLLLADEPTGALDHRTSEALTDLLIDLNNEQNVTLIVVTHSTGLAKKLNSVYLLEDGIVKRQ